MPLIMLLLTGAGGVAAGVSLNKAGAEDADLAPKIWGIPAGPAATVLGIGMALMGGAVAGPLGLAIAVGSLVSQDGMKRAKQGLDTTVAATVKRLMAEQGAPANAPAPPALPGPVGPGGGGHQAMNIMQDALKFLRPPAAEA